MLGLVFVRPFSYAYGFFAFFFFLGFWGKFIAHITLGNPFIEPTGSFDGSILHWDAALSASAAASAGVATARVAHLAYLRRKGGKDKESLAIPSLYINYRKSLWVLTFIAILIVAIWNRSAAIYQIGVNPKVVLPLHLNVLFGWLINWGFALWLACLVHWELKFASKNTWAMVIVMLFEAAAMGISSLSRSAYVFHGLAGLAPWANAMRRRLLFLISWGVAPYLLGLAVTLYVVQMQRSEVYLATPAFQAVKVDGKLTASAAAKKGMLIQVPYLFLNRWVGLEGILAVASYPSKDFQLFKSALRENPKAGVDSIFQRIAGSNYGHSEEFTFLTLAGAASIFYYSNSYAVVFVGMTLVALLILLVEITTNRLTQNPYVLSVSGIAMAYTVTQTTYPYLSAIFFLELICTIVAVAIVARIKLPSNKKQNANA